MGMAASQARLLSITSRMSDNELRAQLINNAKMRLTTDSSRVSDEYIAALNKTQFMFTNFDTMGNEQYQNLTFNSLTAYSSYNNQYGLVNTSGELMVSKTDAANFEKAGGVGGDLEKFLGFYGLAQDTTYFDEFKLDSVGYYDKYGVWQDLAVPIGDMRDIYEGRIDANGIEHYGYDASLNSREYGLYTNLVNDYHMAKEAYQSAVNDEKNKFMAGSLAIGGNKLTNIGGKNFETLYNEVKSLGDADDTGARKYAGFMAELMQKLGYNINTGKRIEGAAQILKRSDDGSEPFAKTIKHNYDIASANVGDYNTDYYFNNKTRTYAFVILDPDGTEVERVINNTSTRFSTKYISTEPTLDSVNGSELDISGGDGKTYYSYPTAHTGTDTINLLSIPEGYTIEPLYSYTVEKEDGTEEEIIGRLGDPAFIGKDVSQLSRPEIKDASGNSRGLLITETTTLSAEDIVDAVKNMYDYFKNNAFDNLDDSKFRTQTSTVEKYKKYLLAANKLANFIYGENGKNIKEEYYDYLDDPSWVLSTNHIDKTIDVEYTRREKDASGNIIEVTYTLPTDNIDRTHFNDNMYPTTTPGTQVALDPNFPNNLTDVSYQAVKDVFLIECMLEHFGEPKYTWIDKANPNENAEAKAVWYTNLFHRMEDGYKALPENLEDSQEWLQFAFESGLLHMEQVDKSNNWVSTMYANCSNITESAVAVDVTVAEAKYKREMNKIEAKDKQYDLELKNIDTEHSSLQTEYDSIKSVIDKNVERNFKMFQA